MGRPRRGGGEGSVIVFKWQRYFPACTALQRNPGCPWDLSASPLCRFQVAERIVLLLERMGQFPAGVPSLQAPTWGCHTSTSRVCSYYVQHPESASGHHPLLHFRDSCKPHFSMSTWCAGLKGLSWASMGQGQCLTSWQALVCLQLVQPFVILTGGHSTHADPRGERALLLFRWGQLISLWKES